MEGNFLKKRKITFAFFLVASIFCIVVFCFFFFRGPAVGTVSKKEAGISREEISVESKVKEFRGTYFSLSLPESFEEKRNEVSGGNGNILEQVFFSESNVDGRKLAIVVERRPAGGIPELSAVAFRELYPKLYARETISVGSRRVVLFIKDERVYEVTGFFEEDDLAASMSVTSAVLRPEKIKDFFFETMERFRFLEKITSSE